MKCAMIAVEPEQAVGIFRETQDYLMLRGRIAGTVRAPKKAYIYVRDPMQVVMGECRVQELSNDTLNRQTREKVLQRAGLTESDAKMYGRHPHVYKLTAVNEYDSWEPLCAYGIGREPACAVPCDERDRRKSSNTE